MREIKFRVWDSRVNKMIYFDLLHSCGMCPPDCLQNVQQFTGLKDKNGKEIYEGDIVLLQSNMSHIKHVCEIFVKAPENSSWFFHARPLPVDDGDRQFCLYYNTYEIIGNNFETPELLKQQL